MENLTVERPAFLKTLLEEIESMDPECFPPPREIRKEDKPLGDCPVYLQKIWALARMCERESEQAKLECKFSSDHDHPGLHVRIVEMGSKEELLMEMFWACVNDHFKQWGELGGLAIRKGWKVVNMPRDPGDKIAGILGQLFNQ